LLLSQVYREVHKEAAAAAIAAEYLDGRDAWEPESRFEDWAMANEPTPYFLALRMRGGAITRAQFQTARAQTLKKWASRVEGDLRSFLWIYAYAAPAETPADAADAMAAIPDFAPLPAYKPLTLADAAIGRAYLLAGRVDDAIPPLETAARSCFIVDHPIESTRAHLWLGEAREAKGDKAGACAEYAVVRERWENAKPRPVTMERAAAHMTALGCARLP
jgi:serine/threonine-protein kinase